jgi:hypothetical protein
MHASAVLLSFFRASLIPGVCFAYSVVGMLFESAWIGSQAFSGANAFNANIGAWNTASVANMIYVCPLCLCLRSVCVMHAFVLLSFLEHFNVRNGQHGGSLRVCARPTAAVAPHLDTALRCMCSIATPSLYMAVDPCVYLHRGRDNRCVRAPQPRPRVPTRVCVRVWVWAHTYPRRNVRALSVGVDRVWLGSQAFSSATAFNANIGAWNVLRVLTYTSAFDGVGLADCIKRGVYDNWGYTFQAAAGTAYPTWSSLSVCTTVSPTAPPRYCG